MMVRAGVRGEGAKVSALDLGVAEETGVVGDVAVNCGKAKICNLRVVLRIEQNILWLQVPVVYLCMGNGVPLVRTGFG